MEQEWHRFPRADAPGLALYRPQKGLRAGQGQDAPGNVQLTLFPLTCKSLLVTIPISSADKEKRI